MSNKCNECTFLLLLLFSICLSWLSHVNNFICNYETRSPHNWCYTFGSCLFLFGLFSKRHKTSSLFNLLKCVCSNDYLQAKEATSTTKNVQLYKKRPYKVATNHKPTMLFLCEHRKKLHSFRTLECLADERKGERLMDIISLHVYSLNAPHFNWIQFEKNAQNMLI